MDNLKEKDYRDADSWFRLAQIVVTLAGFGWIGISIGYAQMFNVTALGLQNMANVFEASKVIFSNNSPATVAATQMYTATLVNVSQTLPESQHSWDSFIRTSMNLAFGLSIAALFIWGYGHYLITRSK
jgi:hypothetical protein